MVEAIERDFRGSFSGHERNRFYVMPDGERRPGGRFFDAAYVLGVDAIEDGRSALPFDMDGDGDLDLAVLALRGLRLFENTGESGGFVRLRLEATRTDPQALGAIVSVTADGRTQRDHVKVTEGFQTQVPRELHFGLGSAQRVDRVVVEWPSGAAQEWRDLDAGGRVLLREGDDGARRVPLAVWPEETRPAAPPHATLAAPAADLDGESTPLAAGDVPTVVNFWAPWCEPCRDELPQLARVARAVEGRVDFVGVSVETEDEDLVREAIARHGLPYDQRLANDELMQAFHGGSGAAALPSTFVFDREGTLRRVFRRPVAGAELDALVEALLDDTTSGADLVRRATRQLETGDAEGALATLEDARAVEPDLPGLDLEVGNALITLGRLEEAEAAFARATERDPDHAVAWHNLAFARVQRGARLEAIEALREELRIIGPDPRVLGMLGRVAADAGSFDVALTAYEMSIDAEPTAAAWAAKGMVLVRLERFDDALECFDAALALDPDFTPAAEARTATRARLR